MTAANWSSDRSARWDAERLTLLMRRFGLIVTAIVLFGAGSALAEQGNFISNRFTTYLSMLVYAVAFTLLLLAVVRTIPRASDGLILVGLLLAFAAYAHIHQITQLHSGMPLTTDVHLYSDYAARLLRMGQNPYQFDLLDSYRVNRATTLFSTPTLDGFYTARVNYPALAFLVYVPFQWLHIPGEWVFPAFFVLTLIVIFWRTPGQFRPIVLLPFFADVRYVNYITGGVSDIVWACFLVLMILSWRRTRQAALCFGLACAFKQQPWLFAPFLVIRLWYETDGSARDRLRRALIFSGIAAAVFLCFNLPFMAWDFRAWLAGISEPISGPLILLGQGLSSLSVLGIVIAPRWFYTATFAGIFLLALAIYAARFRDLREAMWLFPSLALWFGARSLTSYWYFNLIPLVVALFWMPELTRAADTVPHLRVRLALPSVELLVGVPALVILGALIVFHAAPPAFMIRIGEPIGVAGNSVSALQIEVTNNTGQTLTPRFSVQSWADQPFFWPIDAGPKTLAAGATSQYSISTTAPFATFDITQGAIINVTDAVEAGARAAAMLPADLSVNYPDSIPNGHFVYWLPNNASPYLWDIRQSKLGTGSITLDTDPEINSVLKFRLIPSPGPAYSSLSLGTRMPLPDVPFQLWVRPPAGSNQLPTLDTLYGLELDVSEQQVFVLFGDAQRTGSLGENQPYWMIPAPPGVWSRLTLDLRAILSQLGVDPLPTRQLIPRFNHFDYARTALTLNLVLKTRSQTAPLDAEFGSLDSLSLHPDPDTLVRQRLARPEIPLLWSADVNAEMGNDDAAARDYAAAIQSAADPRPAQFEQAEYRFQLDDWQGALAGYTAVAQAGYRPADAYKGVGWTNIQLGRFDAARSSFEQAIRLYTQLPNAATSSDLADAYGGLGRVQIEQRQCEQASASFEQARLRQPAYQIPLEALVLCFKSTGQAN